jgi:hypothetical protein
MGEFFGASFKMLNGRILALPDSDFSKDHHDAHIVCIGRAETNSVINLFGDGLSLEVHPDSIVFSDGLKIGGSELIVGYSTRNIFSKAKKVLFVSAQVPHLYFDEKGETSSELLYHLAESERIDAVVMGKKKLVCVRQFNKFWEWDNVTNPALKLAIPPNLNDKELGHEICRKVYGEVEGKADFVLLSEYGPFGDFGSSSYEAGVTTWYDLVMINFPAMTGGDETTLEFRNTNVFTAEPCRLRISESYVVFVRMHYSEIMRLQKLLKDHKVLLLEIQKVLDASSDFNPEDMITLCSIDWFFRNILWISSVEYEEIKHFRITIRK